MTVNTRACNYSNNVIISIDTENKHMNTEERSNQSSGTAVSNKQVENQAVSIPEFSITNRVSPCTKITSIFK